MLSKASTIFNVLLVEEDPKQTEIYSDLIREVSTGEVTVDVASRTDSLAEWIDRSSYHLVVIDISGKADGLSLLERVRRISPETAVILLSNKATIEEAVAAVRLGAEDYLNKPFNVESFQLAVKRGLDRKAVYGENVGASSFLNLFNCCQMISASLEPSRIFDTVKSYFTRELGAEHSAVFTLRTGAGAPELLGEELVRIDRVDGDRGVEEILSIALQAANPLPKMREASETYRFIERGQLSPGLFIFRFRCAGAEDYFCVCLSPQRPTSLEEFESRLRMLKAQIEVTGKNIEQYNGVQNLVYMDDATGLYNTRYLNYILDREISQAQTSGKSFAILFLDCDKFKSVNDNYGHLIGTRLLNELGNQLKTFVREKDTVFRYGGDEFIAVLSPCDLNTAKMVAERIRHTVEQTAFIAEEGLNVRFTVSIGVALYPDHADSKRSVMEAADAAMYSAKRTTRNHVFIAPISDAAKKAQELRAKEPPAKKPKEGGSSG